MDSVTMCIIVYGESKVGKTTMINSLINEVYSPQTPTIGIDFHHYLFKPIYKTWSQMFSKPINTCLPDSCSVMIKFYDLSGNPRFENFIMNTFNKCFQGLILVY